MSDTSAFRQHWRAFARAHTHADQDLQAELIRQVLDLGLDRVPLAEHDAGGETGHTDDETADERAGRLEAERQLIARGGLFDEFGYFWHNSDLPWYFCGHDEQLRHFVVRGWKELRHPYPGFDLWWYWLTYLDPKSELVNPVVHYLAEGRHRGYVTLPEVGVERPLPPPPSETPRRVCLFAGFDADGIVDDTVVAYLRDLSRFADIYYLADCALEEGELDKLAPYTKGRWAIRHGRYDFGSYSMLARDLVGWDVVETYDELILANDSCYLVQPFDEVFSRMDSSPGDWWGLQATYDYFTVREFKRLGRPLRLDEVEEAMRTLDMWRYSDFIHVGSYLVAFRADVIADPEFRRRLDTVAAQTDKTTIIMKYEIGLSRYLILAGYHLATFVDGILAYHPVYRESAFELMGDGFPLLKRQFLYENPFSTPDLVRWKQRVLAEAPGADVAAIERNLLRVAPAWSLHRSFAVQTLPDGSVALPPPIGPETFVDEERWSPRFDHWWAFPVDPVSHRIEGNQRAVFEVVRDDSSIKKLVLFAEDAPRLGGANVVAHPVDSAPAQHYLLRAGQIFVSDGPRADVDHPLSGQAHQFIGLGRGTPLLAFGTAAPLGADDDGRRPSSGVLHDLDLTTAVIASSDGQADAMRPALRSPRPPHVWVTGTPRTDLLLGRSDQLPRDLARQQEAVRELAGQRRLVVWAPAARAGRPVPAFAADDLAWLADWAGRDGAFLALRPPPGGDADLEAPWTAAGFAVLDATAFPDVEMVLREATALISDYTPELIDFLVTGRSLVAWTPDLEEVRASPGLLHDLDDVVPGGPCRDLPALRSRLEGLFETWTPEQAAEHAAKRDRVHAFLDGRSAARVVRRVKETYLPIEEWLSEPDS